MTTKNMLLGLLTVSTIIFLVVSKSWDLKMLTAAIYMATLYLKAVIEDD
ncbi:TPA: hypothetical protein ACHR26_001765 [Streptococcus equi subsp. zooepidemicus]